MNIGQETGNEQNYTLSVPVNGCIIIDILNTDDLQEINLN